MPGQIKTIEQINEKIRNREVVVVSAEDMPGIVDEKGAEEAAREVDVVTTGTFGAMCSSGAWLNFGHSDPPIKMKNVFLNDVQAYSGVAAVDAYLGAAQMSRKEGFNYGGGHVLEDLVKGQDVTLEADAYGTDCYPRKQLEIDIGLEDLNQAIMINPRNGYQKYNAATNSREETIYTYMGALLPGMRNVTFSGSGTLNPLSNDPHYRTIGMGTRIFLGGVSGYVIGQGTQHSPRNGFGTLMVKGNLKEMSSKFIRGATFQRYGTTLYIGIGIPIPILDPEMARFTAIRDEDIYTHVMDYGTPRRDRPKVTQVTYAQLRSGQIEIDGREVPVSPLSSYKMAREIALLLKKWLEKGEFTLTAPVENLPMSTEFNPMKAESAIPFVEDVSSKEVVTISPKASIKEASKKLTDRSADTLIVQGEDGILKGILTTWDIAKALSVGASTAGEVMTTKVIAAHKGEPIDLAARKLEKHGISALPIVDADRKVVGMISEEDIARFVGRRKW